MKENRSKQRRVPSQSCSDRVRAPVYMVFEIFSINQITVLKQSEICDAMLLKAHPFSAVSLVVRAKAQSFKLNGQFRVSCGQIYCIVDQNVQLTKTTQNFTYTYRSLRCILLQRSSYSSVTVTRTSVRNFIFNVLFPFQTVHFLELWHKTYMGPVRLG